MVLAAIFVAIIFMATIVIATIFLVQLLLLQLFLIRLFFLQLLFYNCYRCVFNNSYDYQSLFAPFRRSCDDQHYQSSSSPSSALNDSASSSWFGLQQSIPDYFSGAVLLRHAPDYPKDFSGELRFQVGANEILLHPMPKGSLVLFVQREF